MPVLDVQKLTSDPGVYAPNTLYLIGPTNSPNELQIALSSNDGSIVRRTITRDEVQNLISTNTSFVGNAPIGTVIKSLSPITPSGYLKCNGTVVSKTIYSDLYNIIGDIYAPLTTSGGAPWQSQYGFNPSTQSDITDWTSSNSLITNTFYMIPFVTKNYIYVLGGYTGGGAIDTIQRASFDANGNLISTWSNVGTLPVAMYGMGYVAAKGRIYLIGGADGIYALSSVYSAPINSDGTLGVFRTETPLPGVRQSPVCFVIKNKLYAVGGWTGGASTSTIYRTTINNDGVLSDWETLPNFPTNFYNGSLLLIRDRIYIFGVYNGANSKIYYTTFDSNGNIGSWISIVNMPNNIYGSAIVCTDNYVFSIGGYDLSNAQYTNTTYRAAILADGSIGSWTQISNAPIAAMIYNQSVIAGNRIYFIGGFNGSSFLNSIYSATFTSGITDYTPYYNDQQNIDSNKFYLPDYQSSALLGENFYIKY
jgi:hypothetical protein